MSVNGSSNTQVGSSDAHDENAEYLAKRTLKRAPQAEAGCCRPAPGSAMSSPLSPAGARRLGHSGVKLKDTSRSASLAPGPPRY